MADYYATPYDRELATTKARRRVLDGGETIFSQENYREDGVDKNEYWTRPDFDKRFNMDIGWGRLNFDFPEFNLNAGDTFTMELVFEEPDGAPHVAVSNGREAVISYRGY